MNFSTRAQMLEGLRDGVPVMIAVVFFGTLFGATAVNNGLAFWQTITSSALVFAGASQFVFLDLYNQQVPVWSVLLAVFAVNFRHVLYSAAITRHVGAFSTVQKYFGFFLLTDVSFSASLQRINNKTFGPAYYFGLAIPFYPLWLGSTILGAAIGDLITDPQALGLDMLLSLYFLALLIGFRSRPNWLSVVIASGLVSVLVERTIGSPWHIMSGAVAGMALAAAIGKPDNSRQQTVSETGEGKDD